MPCGPAEPWSKARPLDRATTPVIASDWNYNAKATIKGTMNHPLKAFATWHNIEGAARKILISPIFVRQIPRIGKHRRTTGKPPRQSLDGRRFPYSPAITTPCPIAIRENTFTIAADSNRRAWPHTLAVNVRGRIVRIRIRIIKHIYTNIHLRGRTARAVRETAAQPSVTGRLEQIMALSAEGRR